MSRLSEWMKTDREAITVALLVALLIRVVYGWGYFTSVPLADAVLNDARSYWEMSLAMSVYGWWLPDTGAYYQAPLYPAFLSMLRMLGLHETTPVLWFQLGLGVVNALLTYLVARAYLSPRWSALASCLFSATHLPLFFESKILATTTGLTLLLLTLIMMLRGFQQRSLWIWALAGVLMGLAILARPNLLFTLPCLLLIVAWHGTRSDDTSRKGQWIPAILFLLATVGTVAPVPLRNGIIGGDWVPVTANAGVTLYMGNNPLAMGGLGRIEGLSDNIEDQRTQSIDLASKRAGHELSAAQASRFWISESVRWAWTHPVEFLSLLGRKLLWGFYHTPPAVNQSVHFEARFLPALQLGALVTSVLLFLGLPGLVVAAMQRRAHTFLLLAWVAGYAILTGVYYASDRFLVAVLPAFAITSALFLQQWTSLPRLQKTALVGLALLAALVAMNPWLAPNALQETANGWYNLGVQYEARQDLPAAATAYRQAIELRPDHVSALLNLGVLRARQNDLHTSTRLFEEVLRIDPDHALARQNLQINRQRMNR